MWSPSSKMMKRSVSISPGVHGDSVVSQPVPPPIGMPLPSSSSMPVPFRFVIGVTHLFIIPLKQIGSEVHSLKKPAFTVIGLFLLSNEMLVLGAFNDFDVASTRNLSLNSVPTNSGYS